MDPARDFRIFSSFPIRLLWETGTHLFTTLSFCSVKVFVDFHLPHSRTEISSLEIVYNPEQMHISRRNFHWIHSSPDTKHTYFSKSKAFRTKGALYFSKTSTDIDFYY
jgi:hypothetical protein